MDQKRSDARMRDRVEQFERDVRMRRLKDEQARRREIEKSTRAVQKMAADKAERDRAREREAARKKQMQAEL